MGQTPRSTELISSLFLISFADITLHWIISHSWYRLSGNDLHYLDHSEFFWLVDM